MLIEHSEFNDTKFLAKNINMSSAVFRYCSFKKATIDGGNVDATFIACELSALDWYWGLFNCCLFVDVKFEECIFRGTSFAACRFLNCNFINCRFEKDNLKSPCSFTDSEWFGGTTAGCIGLPPEALGAMSKNRKNIS